MLTCSMWQDASSIKIMIMITIMIMMMMIIIRINKFFEVDFAIKVNASNERRFDRSTVIFKFGVRIKLHV